jgi:hypothetical protein
MSVGGCHSIFHKNLKRHCLCERLVPKMLTPENKETRMTPAGDLISIVDQDVEIFNNIVTREETWRLLYVSCEWKAIQSPPQRQSSPSQDQGQGYVRDFLRCSGSCPLNLFQKGVL